MTDDQLTQLELRFLERGYDLLTERLEDGTFKAEAHKQQEGFGPGRPPTGSGSTRLEATLRCWGDLPRVSGTGRREFP